MPKVPDSAKDPYLMLRQATAQIGITPEFYMTGRNLARAAADHAAEGYGGSYQAAMKELAAATVALVNAAERLFSARAEVDKRFPLS